MKTLIVIIAILTVLAISSEAFAFGYHCNRYGTCYYRDDSNDGNPYNNANYLGLN